MIDRGSQEKPDIKLSPTEEMATVLRVPTNITLSDGRTIKMRKLKITELLEFSEELIVVFRTLVKTRQAMGTTKKQQAGFFMAQMVRALWPTLAGVIQRVIVAEPAYDVKEADADDALLILARFVKLHERVKQAFFELMEAFVPEVAVRIQKAYQDLSTSSSVLDISGSISEGSATKS